MAPAASQKGNLPVPITSLVGRQKEVAEIRVCLSKNRLVTLTGPGGVGKTRLALAAATDLRRAFRDGVWWVELAGTRDGSLIADEVAGVLKLGVQPASSAHESVAAYLASRRILLVLDNCEHLSDACARFTGQMLRQAPELRMIATSRRMLGIGGEHLIVVPPLAVPDQDAPPPPEETARYDAIRLLAERAAALRPGIAITAANHKAAVRLCARLDGIPLAIELAAARMLSLSVEQVLDRLDDRFALLVGGSRAAMHRQQTLRAMTDWSHDLCSERDRVLWARLSIFVGGFDLDAAEQVCSDGELPAAEILDCLHSLVVQSVVLAEPGAEGTRFRLLETIRQYGWDRLGERGEDELPQLLRRHRDFYLRLACQAADTWCGPDQEAALARLRVEHGNLRAAFETCMTDPDGPAAALELASALRFHWTSGGFLGEGSRWLDAALALPDQPPRARVTALWVAAWVALLQGDAPAAAARLAECEQLASVLPDRRAAAHAESLRATALMFVGDVSGATARFESAASVLHEVGDPEGELRALFQLGFCHTQIGDSERATTVHKRGLALSEARGERLLRSFLFMMMGFDAWQRGNVGEAVARHVEGLSIQRSFDDPLCVGLMIEGLAWVADSCGDHACSAALLGAARAAWSHGGTTIHAFGPRVAAYSVECERRTRQALGNAALEAIIEENGALTVAQAISLALDQSVAVGAPAPAPAPVPAPAPAAAAEPPTSPLTRREQEIAVLIARGMTNRTIASVLVLSPRTIDGHVGRIFAKLGFVSRAQVAAWVSERKAASGR